MANGVRKATDDGDVLSSTNFQFTQLGDPELALKCAWFTPTGPGQWGRVVHFQGPPGGGKTSRNRQAAHSWGMPEYTLICSIREPADILGMNVPNMRWELLKDHLAFYIDGIRREPEKWAKDLLKCERAVLTIDEASTMVLATQHAALRVVHEKVVGDEALPGGIRIIMLSNPASMVGGWEHNPALANRVTWVRWPKTEVPMWQQYMLSRGAALGASNGVPVHDPAAEEARVLKLWETEHPVDVGRICGFMQAFPALLEVDFPPDGRPVWGHPTPRSWEAFTQLLTSTRIHGLSEADADVMLEGTVGPEAAQAYRMWETAQVRVNVLDVLDGKEVFIASMERPDLAAVVFFGMAGLLESQSLPDRERRAAKFWEIAHRALDVLPDTVKPATDIVTSRAGLGLKRFPSPKDHCAQVLAKLQVINDAA